MSEGFLSLEKNVLNSMYIGCIEILHYGQGVSSERFCQQLKLVSDYHILETEDSVESIWDDSGHLINGVGRLSPLCLLDTLHIYVPYALDAPPASKSV